MQRKNSDKQSSSTIHRNERDSATSEEVPYHDESDKNDETARYLQTDPEVEPTVRREEAPEEEQFTYGEENGEENEYDEEDNPNLIIINDHIDDDKKVVYLSNINSCSLPQTPKIDENEPRSGFILEQTNRNASQYQNFLSQSPSQIGEDLDQL